MEDNVAILACKTLQPELEYVMHQHNSVLPVFYVESGLHAWPDKLRVRIQELLDELPSQYTTVLMLYGFCGNSLVGIVAHGRKLILPLASDCFPIFLGSQAKRNSLGTGTYFFTEGYLHSEHTVVSEHTQYLKRYTEKRAESITKTMMKHYTNLTVINTGAYDIEPVVDEIKPFAEKLALPINIVEGDLCFLEDLVCGNWENGKFLIVAPGSTIRFEDSLTIPNS